MSQTLKKPAFQRKVLIAEDDCLLRGVLAQDFKRRGFEVTEACDGEQAIELVKVQFFDLIISDVMMPKKNGIELLAAIQKIRPKIPVFMFITGLTEMSLAEALQKGARALFPKPFDRKVFFKAVERALAIQNEKRESISTVSTDFEVELAFSDRAEKELGKMLRIERGRMLVSLNPPPPVETAAVEFEVLLTSAAGAQNLRGQGVIREIHQDKPSTSERVEVFIEFLKLDNNSPELALFIENIPTPGALARRIL